MSTAGKVIISGRNGSLFLSSGKGGSVCQFPTSVPRSRDVLLWFCGALIYATAEKITARRIYVKRLTLTWWHVMSSADHTNIPETAWAAVVFRNIWFVMLPLGV